MKIKTTNVEQETLTPLRRGEFRCASENGHNDVRNDGNLCFAHPGITWCETCGALYKTEQWAAGCQAKH